MRSSPTEVKMGDVFAIRPAVLDAPATLNEAVERAYRQASGQAAWSRIPPKEAYAILINSILDGAARGLRDVDLLCGEALARLSEEENSRLP
jgi:hypothetical protein